MDYIVTEKTVYCLADHVLQPISREMCAMENALE
jgi:hypothetical protein